MLATSAANLPAILPSLPAIDLASDPPWTNLGERALHPCSLIRTILQAIPTIPHAFSFFTRLQS